MGLDKSFQKKFVNLTAPAQGACPEGFHVPSNDEWNLLDSLVEAEYGYVSPSLRSKTGWTERDYPATDTTGFGALPAGKRWLSKFDDLGEKTIFWTADEDHTEFSGDGGNAMLYSLDARFHFSGGGSYMKNDAVSVRCVK
jgi:uncharacterized protein (TIGR02145 family)